MSPTVFNVVVEATIWHWVKLVAPMEAGEEVLRETIHKLAALSYADGGLVVLPWPERIQKAFNVLTDLFNRVGLRTTVRNTVRMACRPCYIVAYFWSRRTHGE